MDEDFDMIHGIDGGSFLDNGRGDFNAGKIYHWQTVATTSGSEMPRVTFDISQASQRFDHMIRVSTDYLTQTVVSQSWETSEFMSGVMQWASERNLEADLLKSFAAWQKNKLDYNAVHTAWLMEAMTYEEFADEAAKFVTEITDQDPHYVVDVADRLTKLLPFELSTSELAEFLRTEPRLVLDSIAMFGQHSEKLRELLPDDKRQTPSE